MIENTQEQETYETGTTVNITVVIVHIGQFLIVLMKKTQLLNIPKNFIKFMHLLQTCCTL